MHKLLSLMVLFVVVCSDAAFASPLGKELPDGSPVAITDAVVTAAVGTGGIYIRESFGLLGINVRGLPDTATGERLSFSATVQTDATTGERYLAADPETLQRLGQGPQPKPVHMQALRIDKASAGLLMTVTERLTDADSGGGFFILGDGLSVAWDGQGIQAGQLLSVTGVISLFRDGEGEVKPQLLPGNAADVRERLADLGPNSDLNGLRLLPDDNPWNTPVDTAPIDPSSDAIIASIGASTGLKADFGANWNGGPFGIPYVVVGGDQARVPVSFEYDDESDPGPYPVPPDAPIEGGPASTGDRHILVLDRDNWMLYELFFAYPDGGGGWTAGSGAIFDLHSNALRPAGWTSADAAGLPILPGLVRWDEVVAGEIRHALRFTVSRTRRAYVPPATHWASSYNDPSYPPMGMRVRLKAAFDITPYPARVRVILCALKKYGMIVADNGSNWYISGAPDVRWDDDELAALRSVKGSNFEVIRMDGLVTP